MLEDEENKGTGKGIRALSGERKSFIHVSFICSQHIFMKCFGFSSGILEMGITSVLVKIIQKSESS